jgi:ribosomal protein S18 acetylase RimI-like enzyme
VVDYAKASKVPIDELYLHVQVSNTGAIEFYQKFGFEITETIEKYYKHITPASAHVITRKVN